MTFGWKVTVHTPTFFTFTSKNPQISHRCGHTLTMMFTSSIYDSDVRSKRPKSLPVMMKRAVRWRDCTNRTTTSAQWSHRWGRRWRRLVLSSQAAANQRAGNKTLSQQVRNDYSTASTLFSSGDVYLGYLARLNPLLVSLHTLNFPCLLHFLVRHLPISWRAASFSSPASVWK